MKKIFLDTSSLVKLYHEEIDSERVKNYFLKSEKIFLSEIAKVEFVSAILKKAREKVISESNAKILISLFLNDCSNFSWVFLDSILIAKSLDLLMIYGSRGLRTLDSIQLASALTLKNKNCIFLTSDILLKSIFTEERLEAP